ncbi:FAD-dependent oxidoreductase [Haloferula helveola]
MPDTIDRRRFVRIIGGLAFTAATAPRYGFGAEGKGSAGVLVEACGFDEPGGWVIDTQFYQQMGGSFLLAHGMGKPVANAKTKFKLPEGGKWYVWVRTRDWCPGEWEAPGRFRVKVDGKALEPVFGTEEGWAWQAGGAIEVDAAGEHALELEDLTGFDGRCDAVFFTREEKPELPNMDLPELAAWKDRLSGRTGQVIEEDEFDVVIVGAGMSGCGAALAARTQGLRVALIQDRPMLGGNASAEIRVHTIGIHGKGAGLLKKIDTEHYPNGDAKAKLDQDKRERTMKESGVEIFAHHIAIGLGQEGERITSVEAREVTSGQIRRFKAPVFIDATGDGWLGFWAGAEYREGREASSEFDEGWDKHGDLWSPEKPDAKVMGTSVLWNSTKGTTPSRFPEVPWAMPVAGKHAAINGEWYWEYSSPDLDQVKDAERIRDHMLRAIFGSFANAKKQPKNATVALEWVAYVGGKRESRRLMGDYVYTMKDATERRTFEDVVVEEKRELDTHYQLKETGAPTDFLSKAIFRKTGGLYYIPFRCFYSKNIPNLMMAGRCFSCSHIGLSGPRVMLTCGQMGLATGYAAALCKKHGALPREVGEKHVAELKKLVGYEA